MALLSGSRHACSCGLDGRWMISVSMITITIDGGSLISNFLLLRLRTGVVCCRDSIARCNLFIPRVSLKNSESIWNYTIDRLLRSQQARSREICIEIQKMRIFLSSDLPKSMAASYGTGSYTLNATVLDRMECGVREHRI